MASATPAAGASKTSASIGADPSSGMKDIISLPLPGN